MVFYILQDVVIWYRHSNYVTIHLNFQFHVAFP